MKKPVQLLPALFGLLVLLMCGISSAGVFTWNGPVSGDWFAASNWTPAGVPGPTDTINVTTGAIKLTGAVAIQGVFNWSGGSLSGDPLTIAGGGMLNITGGVIMENVLTNAGTVAMAGNGSLTLYNDNSTYHGGVYNLPGALWDFQTNANIFCACYGHEFFSNAGVLRKSSGSASSSIQVSFANAGVVSNLSGTLNFNNGGTLNGSYNTAAGAVIGFEAGSFIMGVPPMISGAGLCEFTGSTLTLAQDVAANLVLAGGTVVLGPGFQNGGNITNLTLSGATLSGTNLVTGAFNWSGGTVSSPLTVTIGGVLNITGGVIMENVLTNAGTVAMAGNGSLTLYNDNSTYHGGVYNLPGALWDFQTNANIFCACYGHEFFSNAGVLRKSSGSASSSIQVSFTNAGVVSNLSGTLNFNNGGTLNGSYNIAAGAVVNFETGSFIMGVPPMISGAGLCEFTGSMLTLAQDVAANLVLAGGTVVLGPGFQNGGNITNLTLSGATLSGTNLVTGAFNWSGGTVSSPLTVTIGGVLDITGGVILENVLTNLGTVAMAGNGSLTLYNDDSTYHGGVYNLAGALWDFQTNANIFCACYGHEFFSNAGVLRKSSGSASSSIQVSFANAGVVSNLSGTLNFNNGGILNGSYNTAAGAVVNFETGGFTMGVPPVLGGAGLYQFTGTTLALAQDVASNLVLAGGTVVLGPGFQNGGNITNLTLSGATLSGTNLVTGAFTWNDGAIGTPLTVAGGGVLNITGGVIMENVLTNAGTVAMTGNGSLTLYNDNSTYHGGVYNLAGALWDFQTNANIFCACYGHEFFSNAGVLRKSQGSASSSIQVNFTNAGTVDAVAGTLNLGTGFTNASGTLAFGVSGLNSFGQMNIPGNATLDGTVSLAWLGGFTPAVGNSFALLDYGSHGGTFANVSLPLGAMGEGNYGATVFSVLITSISTQPSLSIELANPNTAIVFWPASASNFGLQTSASLSPGGWSDVLSGIGLAGTNQVFTNTSNGKAAFFRLRSR